MDKRPYLLVRAQVDPKVWDEFNIWHHEVHVPNVMRIPGIVAAYRLLSRRSSTESLMLYKFADEESLQRGLSSEEASRARADWQQWAPHLTELSVEVYALLTPLLNYHHWN